jgi:hypothetical protein
LEKGMVKLIGSIEGREKEEVKKAPNPKIIAVTWIMRDKDKEINSVAYGKTIRLKIETEEAQNTQILICISCDNWEKDYISILTTQEKVQSKNDKKGVTISSFSPDIEWVKDVDVEKCNIYADVYLFTCNAAYWPVGSHEMIAEKAKGKQVNNFEYNDLYFKSRIHILTEANKTKEIELRRPAYIGYYYTKDGEYLGKIGTSGNICVSGQIEFSQRKNSIYPKTGILDLTEEYGLTHEQVLDRANWIYAEGGYEIPEYYAFTMENLVKKYANENSLYNAMVDSKNGKMDRKRYFKGDYDNKSGIVFWNKREKPETFTTVMCDCIRAVIMSKIRPDLDPTGGTCHWLGYQDSKDHRGQYYIKSRGSKHYFQLTTVDSLTNKEKIYSKIYY